MKTVISGKEMDAVVRFSCTDLVLPQNEALTRVAQTGFPVLIEGETGTGKELLARALHLKSGHSSGPFVVIDCGALAPTLAESELFGYLKGSFTGATSSRLGLFATANGGTVLLDEIGELPLELQPKLLRVLQEREVRPIGSSQTVCAAGRVLAATSRDLQLMVQQNTFRADLYHRLSVWTLQLPPLRDRASEIPELCASILDRLGLSGLTLDSAALELLRSYDWPGNVRELENCLKRIATVRRNGDVISAADFPAKMRIAAECRAMHCRSKTLSLAELEKRTLLEALSQCGGDKRKAAEVLGIGKTTLYRKLKIYKTA